MDSDKSGNLSMDSVSERPPNGLLIGRPSGPLFGHSQHSLAARCSSRNASEAAVRRLSISPYSYQREENAGATDEFPPRQTLLHLLG